MTQFVENYKQSQFYIQHKVQEKRRNKMIKEKFNVRNKSKTLNKSPRKLNEYELKFNYMYSSGT